MTISRIGSTSLFAAFCLASCSGAPLAKFHLKPVAAKPVMTGSSLDKARSLFARGEYALAIEAFRVAARENPDDASAYNGLAAGYDMLGRFDLSGRYYELALAHAPEDGRIYRNMARSLEMQGKTDEALALRAEWDGMKKDPVAESAFASPLPASASLAPLRRVGLPQQRTQRQQRRSNCATATRLPLR
jgi:tetratricopeptide (TPR) repeat protein